MSRNGMKSLLDEIGTMAEMQKKGDSEWFIPLDKLEGEFRQVASVVNEMVKFNIDTSLKILHVVASYGKGDFTAILDDMPGKQKIANEKLNLLRSSLVGVLADANILSKAAVEGKLATRADASKHEGDFRKIVEGVNDTLDAVIGPLNVAAEYVDRISKGDIPPKITDSYNGEFNEIKNNLNVCIDTLNGLISEMNHMSTSTTRATSTWPSRRTSSRAPTRPWPRASTPWSPATSRSRRRPWPASPNSAGATSTRRWRSSRARRPSSTTTSSNCGPI